MWTGNLKHDRMMLRGRRRLGKINGQKLTQNVRRILGKMVWQKPTQKVKRRLGKLVRQANAERKGLAGEDDKSKAIAGGKVQAGECKCQRRKLGAG